MFTGIIEDIGEIEEAGDSLLRIRVRRILDETKPGDSVAIDGVDLTVTEIADGVISFNVMPETYRMTALDRLERGSRVNLERATRIGDRLSGHIVRGVVEEARRIESTVSPHSVRRPASGRGARTPTSTARPRAEAGQATLAARGSPRAGLPQSPPTEIRLVSPAPQP